MLMMSTPLPQIDLDDLEQLSLIGEGDGGNTVYKVVHHPTGNLYALKKLGKSPLNDPYLEELIPQEIKILRDMDHPNLIKFYQFYNQGGNILLLLEYMNCKSLEGTKITNESLLSDIANQVLSSLCYLHRRKLLHRNIRPSKIFISSQKGIKTLFLGRILTFHSESSSIAYKSPESFESNLQKGIHNGYSGDIWSLGLSILELYLGSFPYEHGKEADLETLKQTILHEQPPEAPPTASPEFAEFISCCLKKDQRERWTAEQLLSHPFILLNKSSSRKTQGLSVTPKPAFSDSRDYNSAALSIQKKYRGWKGHKEFLQIRQKVVKIQAHVRGYQVRKIYKVFVAVDIPEESGVRRHRGGVGLRGFQHETKPIDETEREEVQKLSHWPIRKADSAGLARWLLLRRKFPDKIQQHQGNLEEYGEDKGPSSPSFSSSSSPSFSSSSTSSSTQEELFESALQLFYEDCPDRWEKVPSIVGGGKSAEDVKNHWKTPASENKISYSKQALPMPRYAPIKPQNKRATTTVIMSSPERFREDVMKFTENREEKIKEKTKARESEYVSVIQTEIGDKRTYDMKGKKESTKIAPCTDTEFENLPEYVRRCVTYCTLFPLGHEFEKDTLVQLWIAEGLIDAKAEEKMENQGSACFDILVYKEYIVPSSFDKLYKQPKYKVNEAKASLWYFPQGLSKDTYLRIEDGKLEHICKTTLHLSLQKLDSTDFEALKNCKQLRTLLYLGECGSSIKHLPHDLPLCLKSLRTLDLSRTLISGLPISVGCLEALHYLDLSYTPVRVLPRSIGSLYSLQTLKLRDCFALHSLPQTMRKLKNLRHLDFDIVRQLNFMPKGMGRLTNLQTLKAFLVGREDGCNITELKNMGNLTGSFSILRLENVVNVIEAKNAGLNKKQYIKKLELRWGEAGNQNSQDEEEILEYLQPHPNLEELQLLFYSGSVLPSWMCNPSFNKFVSITLWNCKNCCLLPSMGELPALRFLKIVGMSSVRDINRLFYQKYGSQGLKAFPKLEKLTLENMLNLEEWTGMENGDFSSLLQMFIIYCPKLYDLPLLSHLKALKNLEISYCPSLQSLPEEPQLPASLELLVIRECPKVKERCRKDEGEDWRKIAHVPNIWIDEEEISLN